MVKLKVEQISKDIYWNGGFFFILVCHKCILVMLIQTYREIYDKTKTDKSLSMLLLLLLKMVEEIEEKGEHIWMDDVIKRYLWYGSAAL